jgi:hypothetical protein
MGREGEGQGQGRKERGGGGAEGGGEREIVEANLTNVHFKHMKVPDIYTLCLEM